VRGEKEGDVGE
jgi:hypothetical protein